MNTPPDSATVSMPYTLRASSAAVATACTNASWKRRAMTATGTSAALSSRSARNAGAASNSTTEVSCAVLSAVAVFLTTSMA